MSPSPEKTERAPEKTEPPEESEGQQPEPTTQSSAERTAMRGLQMEARVTAPTWEIGLSAVVQDFTPGEVILLLEDQIAAGTRVNIQLNTSSFTGDILFCAPSGSRYEAHVSFDDVDATGLRRTPRFPVKIPARVFSATSDGPLEGTIVDISGEGLGIELAVSVPMHTNIAVQSEENIALGVVRHCRALSSGLFRAGVQLHHIVRKDPELEKASAESGWMNKLGARFGRKKSERPKGWS
jgi:PilZ domain